MRTEPRPILVGIGDTDETRAALGFAAAEATRRGLGVELVHVLPRPSPLLTDSALIGFKGAALVAEDLVAAASERLAHLSTGTVPVTRIVRPGEVSRVLRDLGASAEMIVLQHRSLTALERVVSGSVVVDVAGHATVPVVSVPERWRPGRAVAAVTVALDGHAGQEALLEQAFATAASHGAVLGIMHAWFLGTAYDELVMSRTPLEQWWRVARDHILEQTEEVRSRYPGISVRIDVRHQPAADAIVAAARHSDLVLVGRRHRKHGEHLGPVARSVVSASSVPVMVVPSTLASPADERDLSSSTVPA